MYCVNCGVELADSEQVCPLCGVAAWHPDIQPGRGEPLFPEDRYPNYQVNPKGAQIIVTTLFLLPFFICPLCDFQLSGTITWAGYVMGALAVSYVVLVLPFWFQRPNPVVFVPCSFAAAGLYLLYINLATGGSWFLSFAFPVTGYVGALTTAVTVLLRYIRRRRLWIFGGAWIALGAFMPLMEFLLALTFPSLRFLGWSLYPMIALVLFGGMLLFLALNSRARERMERKFFI